MTRQRIHKAAVLAVAALGLTLVATMINAWNRIAISSRGQYDRKLLEESTAAANDRVAEPA